MPIGNGVIMPRGHSTIGVGPTAYAIMTKDETDGTEYGQVKTLSNATIKVTITPQTEKFEQWADNGVIESMEIFNGIDISLELNDIPPEVQSDWFGQKVDANGVVLSNANDDAPYIALGLRSELANRKHAYKWLYKAKPQINSAESAATMAGSVPTPGTRTVTLSGEKRKSDDLWQASAREGQEGVDPQVIDDWFKAVYVPDAIIKSAPLEEEE